jgi:uncharacterized protein YyaL (SSP411 family)
MDRESYEDPGIAAYLNDRFVCVKVDRDERPDVDSRYQRAVQALTGQGGWPLTAFLTPEGDVFFGGTYFPPDDRFGRQSFRTTLARVAEVFHAQRGRVGESGREVRRHVAGLLAETAPGELGEALLEHGAAQMVRLFDERNGGFGSQPKFPHPAAVEFLLARWWDTGESRLRDVVHRTLTGMAGGGMHDQLGGGFHRYSVDERWMVPHFEKMTYDNAELLKVYLHAYAALGEPEFRRAAEGIVAWSMEVLADRERGGFAASQDADAGLDDDGDYFTWTEEEAQAELSAEEWATARLRWDIEPVGEMHERPGRNVLWAARPLPAIAAQLGAAETQVKQWLAGAQAKLKGARERRPAPPVDRAVYVSWSAMMAEAFLEAADVLGRPDCGAYALRTLERLWAGAASPGGGLRHRADLGAGPVLLDDQVQAASAALAAYERTGEQRWLDRARALMDFVLQRFSDSASGGLRDALTQDGAGLLEQPATPVQDAPTPSPNAVAALVLLKLAAITEESAYGRDAERVLTAFAGAAGELGVFAASLLRAADWAVNGACRIVVADTTTQRTLWRAALSQYRPRKAVVPAATSPVRGVAPPVALACVGTACAAPATTVATLTHTLETFGRVG